MGFNKSSSSLECPHIVCQNMEPSACCNHVCLCERDRELEDATIWVNTGTWQVESLGSSLLDKKPHCFLLLFYHYIKFSFHQTVFQISPNLSFTFHYFSSSFPEKILSFPLSCLSLMLSLYLFHPLVLPLFLTFCQSFSQPLSTHLNFLVYQSLPG